jgi:hypothetical protein
MRAANEAKKQNHQKIIDLREQLENRIAQTGDLERKSREALANVSDLTRAWNERRETMEQAEVEEDLAKNEAIKLNFVLSDADREKLMSIRSKAEKMSQESQKINMLLEMMRQLG